MRTLVGLLLGLGFLGAMVYFTLAETEVRCEVCLVYNGNEECRAGSGPDPLAATQIAVSTACAVLAHDRTQNIQCLATPPRSRYCE